MGEASCDSRRASFVVRQWTRRCCNGLCGGLNDRPSLRGAFPVPRDEGRLILGQGRAAKGVDCARIDHVEKILWGDVKCQAYLLESLARWVVHAHIVRNGIGFGQASRRGRPESAPLDCEPLPDARRPPSFTYQSFAPLAITSHCLRLHSKSK